MIKSKVSSPTSGVRPSESGRGRHDCLDIRSTSGFLCAQPEGWAGLRRRALPHWAKAQSEVQACIRSARAESAGLKAWLKQQEDGFRRDEALGAFDVPHEHPPRYVPFQAHSSRLSPDEHSRLWRQEVLIMITHHLSSRSVFGRPHASREEVFDTLSANGGILHGRDASTCG